jgi:gamma-glutamyltranspeptidase/glutathione hydrolase
MDRVEPVQRRPTRTLRDKGMTEIGNSIHAVTVPGAVDAWEAILKTHGRFGLDRALAQAIKYAEGGFPSRPRVAFDWKKYVGKLKADPGASKHYLFNGAAPNEGDVIRFPALAATLKAIAAKGARAFYEGDIAADMAKTLAARGSFLTAEDFSRHRGDAVRADFNQLSRARRTGNSAERAGAHCASDAQYSWKTSTWPRLIPSGPIGFTLCSKPARLGYAIRDTHIADDAHMRTPVARLLDKSFSKRLASLIDMKKRSKLPSAPAPGNDTVYLTVVDRDRRAVSFINSLYSSFGVGVCTERTGHHADQPRGLLHTRAGSSQYFWSGQAPDAHDHPGPHHAGRPLRHELRRDGRALSAHGSCADYSQHARLRHGCAAGDRRTTVLLRGRKYRCRAWHAGGDNRRIESTRP